MKSMTMNRRSFLRACAAAGLSLAATGSPAACSNGTKCFLYTGSWDEKGGNPGLWLHTYDEGTGKIGKGVKQSETSVGFIRPDYERKLLYVTQEADNAYDKGKELRSGKGGSIFVYQIDEQTGELTQLQESPAYGSNPSMLSFSPDRQYMLCSIHTAKPAPCHAEKVDGQWRIRPAMPSPNCVCFPVGNDGTLGSPTDILAFEWSPGKHVSQLHTVTWAPDGSFFVIADKGTSYLYSVILSPEGKLGSYAVKGDFSLTRIGEGEAVPAELKDAMPETAKFEQQDMRLNEEGTVLYDVVRGSDDGKRKKAEDFGQKVHGQEGGQFQGVSVMTIDQSTHIPQRVQYVDLASCEGWRPRRVVLSPDEKYLVVAFLYGDKLVQLKVNEDGTLDEESLATVEQNTAANLCFYAPEK